jgi:hypothetical protein
MWQKKAAMVGARCCFRQGSVDDDTQEELQNPWILQLD